MGLVPRFGVALWQQIEAKVERRITVTGSAVRGGCHLSCHVQPAT